MKTAKGLREVGFKIRMEYAHLYWDDVMEREDFKRGVANEGLNPLEVEFIKKGFHNEKPPENCPNPDDMFPFGKPRQANKRYREVKPDYYHWFMKQEWKGERPEVLAYCAFYKDGLKRLSIFLRQEDKEIGEIIEDIKNWDIYKK